MGTRIRKILGWGLTDIGGLSSDLEEDKRFNPELYKDDKLYEKIADVEGFLNWLKNNMDECKKIYDKVEGGEFGSLLDVTFLLDAREKGKLNKSRLPDLCTYNPENGDSSVMVFCPIDCKDWQRFDDIIDYYEAECGAEGIEPKVKKLTGTGIWPYQSMVHIPGSPKYGEEGYPNSMMPGEYTRAVGTFSKHFPHPMVGKEALEYYKKYYRPTISGCLILHLYWMGIFNDFYKTIHELRPMIYTYWS